MEAKTKISLGSRIQRFTHEATDLAAYGGIRLFAGLIQRLPLEAALGLGRGLGYLAFCFAGEKRRLAYANLKRAFPQSDPSQRKRWVREMFIHLGMTAMEILRSPVLNKEYFERYVSIQGYSEYLKQREKSQGLILLTAHLGNWELPQIMEGVRGRPMVVLARKQKFKRLDGFLNSFREQYGSVSLEKGEGIRDLIQTLRKGGCVGMLGDQSGGDDGVWVRFLNRLTTAPRGPFALALKGGFTVLPVFITRRKGPHHELFIGSPLKLVREGSEEEQLRANTQKYFELLEAYLRKHPDQWLWGHKRWKRTRTLRIVLLSDGKAGHFKQSETLAKEILEIGQRRKPPYEITVEKVEIQYRNEAMRRLFFLFAFFFIPGAQGRLHWLRPFLAPESLARLQTLQGEYFISAGAGLVPLTLCLARENLAKTLVLMKPPFPFQFFRYDLAVVPQHDGGWLPQGSFRVQGVLSDVDREMLETSKKALIPHLKAPERIRFAVFLGGDTLDHELTLADAESLLWAVELASRKKDVDYLLTTSRRTSPELDAFLKERLPSRPRCQLCVIASEDQRPEVVPGMMGLAEILIVTDDSLSMISEALSSGKKVVVVKIGGRGLPKKHNRFQQSLEKDWGIPLVEPQELTKVLEAREIKSPSQETLERERMRLRERLEALL